MKKLEIIAQSIEDIKLINEIDYPVEIELCGGMDQDGLTPNYKVIKECVNLSNKPIRVMIRNHNDGFYYTPQEVDKMVKQIMDILEFCEPTGFVFGCINKDNSEIDYDALELLSTAATGFSNTFHKAIEAVLSVENINSLRDYNVENVLTQGGFGPILENKEVIKEIMASECEIILGGGVNLSNAEEILSFSNHIHMGSALRINNSYEFGLDTEAIKKVISLLEKE